MDEKAIRKYLEVIRKACNLIEQDLDGKKVEEPVVSAQAESVKVPTQEEHEQLVAEERRQHREARKKHADELFAIDCWPTSVPNHLMLRQPTEQDKINRANAVLDMTLTRSLENHQFLDYGCGEGYTAVAALKRGVASSWAYDSFIELERDWRKFEGGVKFTSDPDKLPKASFDTIMLYDVVDHVHDPVALMNHVKSLLKPGGIVYVRCHPWCSRHASHLFKVGLNKAFIHLFLSWNELAEKGYEPIFTRPEKDPITAYHYWFHHFKTVKETFQKSPVSDFFLVPDFKKLIWDQQDIPPERREAFIEDMQIEFVDYVLTL
jgi:SAM-dependent methyltransferase